MPWALALAAAISSCLNPELWILAAPWGNRLLDTVLVVGGVFVAYLVTAATIIPAVEGKAIVQKLRSWGYFKYLTDYLRSALVSSGLLVLSSILVIPFQLQLASHPGLDGSFSVAWWALLAYTTGAVYRIVRLLLRLIQAR